MAFTVRNGYVPSGKNTRTFVASYECDNCGWRSGWWPEPEAMRLSRIHDTFTDCDCRNKPTLQTPPVNT